MQGRDAMPGKTWRGLRTLLVRDHVRLQRLFVMVLDAFRESAPGELRASFARFDTGLSAHLDAEERYLLPLLARIDPAETAALLAEHASFRRELDDLGVGVDLHAVKLDVALEFVHALRAHADREDRLLYQWAARRLGAPARTSTPVPAVACP